jgi:hypothetical protein
MTEYGPRDTGTVRREGLGNEMTDTAVGSKDLAECWCCGTRQPETSVVRLGNHNEVAVCLRCAHFLHQQARGREDALRPSPAGRARDELRKARRAVNRRGWHQQPVIGRPLRWLGKRLP